ncbi:MAG TPA: LptF/LptG family permease [Gemmatimonadaceae bacterium]|nr:LptF/LptG family permease [Gemmatimonadaceae bacterium]
MKILSRYVLREHVGPLVFALAALTAVLLLNQLAKQFGSLVGKGLPYSVIAQVFALSVPFIVAMTVPMAVLVAVLYAFSRLAAENEITALRASGVSIGRLMRPVLGGATLLAVFMLGFHDQFLPRTNHKLQQLQTDIFRKKPTFALREQVINEVSRGELYLRAGRIAPGSGRMREITIFDLSNPSQRITTYADSGEMHLSPEQSDLVLTLYHGYSQQTSADRPQEVQRLYFGSDVFRVKGVANTLERTNDSYKSDREMTVCEMQELARTSVASAAAAQENLGTRLADAVHRAATGDDRQSPLVADTTVTRHTLGALYCDVIPRLLHLNGGDDDEASPAPPPSDRETAPAGETDTTADSVAPAPATARTPSDAPPHTAFQLADSARRDSARRDSLRRDSVNRERAQRTIARAAAKRDSGPRSGARTRRAAVLRPHSAAEDTTPRSAVAAGAGGESSRGDTSGVAILRAPAVTLSPRTVPGTNRALLNTPAVAVASAQADIDLYRARLLQARQTMAAYEVEINKKFALSAACIVFALLGAPIALRFPRGGVGLVIGVSLGVFALYYVGLIGGETLANSLIVSPFWAMWMANFLFAAVGLYFLSKMRRVEASSRGGDASEMAEAVRAWFRRQFARVGLRRAEGSTPA